MTRFLLVCLGGALGSGTRYLTVLLATRYLGIGFPYGTFAVNVTGSFAIAMVVQLVAPSELRFFLVSGVLGGFTTYSSFNEETLLLMRSGAYGTAVANVLLTVIACLVAGAAGVMLARAIR
jgi:fluoride exporter